MTTYKDAGVDVDLAEEVIKNIKPITRTTDPNILSGIGGFAAAFRIPPGYKKPVMVTCTDGVGTKSKLAHKWESYSSIGQDLVAMNINDLITLGAKPLAFLDYYATNKLDSKMAVDVISGIATACEEAECSLIGGEIAEMPGMYAHNGFELAGFCVGVVEVDDMISGTEIEGGDVLIGLRSSGPHSNGYSLINKIIEKGDYSTSELQWLKDSLLAPTRIYHKPIARLLSSFPPGTVKGMAHITGGGLKENVIRMTKKTGIRYHFYETVVLDSMPSIFNWIQKQGQISYEEMLKTFNCGIGFVVCVDGSNSDAVLGHFRSWKEEAIKIGYIGNC